jgi:hypothetical protein
VADRTYKLDEVYGVARDLPINYVTRDAVDERFVESLARERHIVVFGSSKQGKTSLRKHTLKDDDYIVVMCSNKWTNLLPLHTAILKAAGYIVEQSETRTASGHQKIKATLGAKVGLPFVGGAKGEIEGSADSTTMKATTEAPLELDPLDVNDIISTLDALGFSKFIVLEDFHYLPEDTQRDFAVALKAFHEQSSLCFIVVGVWLDENRLIQYNGDLTERLISVNADAWSPAQLLSVIEGGEELLNVEVDSKFRSELIAGCFESVSVVQETCHQICEDAEVFSTQGEHKVVGEGLDAASVIHVVVEKQSARYNTFLQNFAAGFQTTELEMYRWLLLPVLRASSPQLEKGLSYTDIRQTISANHPTGELNAGNITQALKSIASLQVKLRIQPIILDYDQSTRRITVVDRGFLIWLGHQDRTLLLAEAELPTQVEDPAQLGAF